MTVSTTNLKLGRHVFGAAALAHGLITLAWHDSNEGHQLRYVVYAAAVALISGGAAIQFRRTSKAGAAVLGAAFHTSTCSRMLRTRATRSALTFFTW
jgi:hypothetical protein